MAKPNYKHQKRQKELARKSRQDEKLQKRTPRSEPEEGTAAPGDVVPTTGATPGPTAT